MATLYIQIQISIQNNIRTQNKITVSPIIIISLKNVYFCTHFYFVGLSVIIPSAPKFINLVFSYWELTVQT
ncbi:MAG: hypothetical protein K0R54_439 [Clostridiaceae bacterium]|nr:hypothetical protein [Clostridiaceae bacterium]